MIFERLLIPPPEARLLPAEKLHVPTVAVMAIMTFTMLIVACAGLALSNAAGLVARGAENAYVIELPASATQTLPGVLQAVRSAPGVRTATPVPESEMRETLERWLGGAAASDDLPVPALVMLELEPGVSPAVIEQRARAAAPSARIVSQSGELRPLLRSLTALEWLALALVALMAVATSAAIVLAARGALDTHRGTIDIMHGIGATDAQLVQLFERKIAIDVSAGALGGAIGAAIVLFVLGGGIIALAGNLGTYAPFGWTDLMILVAIPVAAVALALTVAHWTLLRALRATL